MVVLRDGEPVVISNSEYLAHHGVIGMKWGVRRYQNKDGTLTAEGKKRERAERRSEAQKHSEAQKKRDVRNRGALTNQELQEKIQRLRLEKELRVLTDEEVSPGRAMLKKAIENSGQQLMNNAVLGLARYGLNSVADGIGGKGGELLKAMISGNVQTQKSSLDKLRDEVNRMTLQKRYDELTGKGKSDDKSTKSDSSAADSAAKSASETSKTSKSSSDSGNAHGVKGEPWGVKNTGSAPYSNVNQKKNSSSSSKSSKSSTVDATGAEYEIFGEGSSSKKSSSSSSSSKSKSKVYDVKDYRNVDDEPRSSSSSTSSFNWDVFPASTRSTPMSTVAQLASSNMLALPEPKKKK